MSDDKKGYLLFMPKALYEWLKDKATAESKETFARPSVRSVIIRILMEAYNKDLGTK